MNIYAYHGYSQPMSGLAEDLQAAAAQFLQQAPAQVSQAIAPVAQAAPAPMPVAPVMAARDVIPSPDNDKKISWGPILIMLAILYFLMRKK